VAVTTENRARAKSIARGKLHGDDAAIMESLVSRLPTNEPLNADDIKKLEQALRYMAELWLRGISKRKFLTDCGLVEKRKPIHMIAFDFLPVRKAHPEHEAIIDRLFSTVKPPYLWGVTTTASWIKEVFGYDESNFAHWHELYRNKVFITLDETCEKRDVRIMESLRNEILTNAPSFDGCSENFLQLVRELKPAYYTVSFRDDGSARKRRITPRRARR
jgi:hypothetical protein